jgi:hypothetical protein
MWFIRSDCALWRDCKTKKNDFVSGQNEEPERAHWETERLQRMNQTNYDNTESEQKAEKKGDER